MEQLKKGVALLAMAMFASVAFAGNPVSVGPDKLTQADTPDCKKDPSNPKCSKD